MAIMKCFACGKYAQSRLDSGEWICKDCVNSVGGYKNWFTIKKLSPDQILQMMGADGGAAEESSFKGAVRSVHDGMATPKVIHSRPQTIIVKQRGGCLWAIGFLVVLFIVIMILVAVLGAGFSHIPVNGR